MVETMVTKPVCSSVALATTAARMVPVRTTMGPSTRIERAVMPLGRWRKKLTTFTTITFTTPQPATPLLPMIFWEVGTWAKLRGGSSTWMTAWKTKRSDMIGLEASEEVGTCYPQLITSAEAMAAKKKWMCTLTTTWSLREMALSFPGLPSMFESGGEEKKVEGWK